jgi:hypothetical protein
MFMEIFLTAAWSIWKEHNNKVFRGIAPALVSWRGRFKTDFALLIHRAKPSLEQFISNFVQALV